MNLFLFNCCLKTFVAARIPVKPLNSELDKGYNKFWLSVDLLIIFPDNW